MLTLKPPPWPVCGTDIGLIGLQYVLERTIYGTSTGMVTQLRGRAADPRGALLLQPARLMGRIRAGSSLSQRFSFDLVPLNIGAAAGEG